MQVIIHPRILRGLAIIASKDPSRYILNGVCLARKGDGDGHAVVTDGRRLAVMRLDAKMFTGEGEIIVPTDVIRQIDRKASSCIVSHTDPEAGFTVKRAHVKIKGMSYVWELEGKFPAWRQVIPNGQTKPGDAWNLDAELLAGIQQAAFTATGLRGGLHIVHHGEFEPISVRHQCDDFYAVLMPVRWDNRATPAWLDQAAVAV